MKNILIPYQIALVSNLKMYDLCEKRKKPGKKNPELILRKPEAYRLTRATTFTRTKVEIL